MNKSICKTISVNWCSFHGRSESLGRKLDIPVYFIFPEATNLVSRYCKSAYETLRLIMQEKPDSIIVMQPPIVSLIVVAFAQIFHNFKIVGDLHTGVFLDPKWRWSTGIVYRILSGRNSAIVTNGQLEEQLKKVSVDSCVLDDVIEVYEPQNQSVQTITSVKGVLDDSYVLAPLSYAFDEPISDLFDAIRAMPNIKWILTGRADLNLRNMAPDNAIFSGYVSESDYRNLLQNSAGIIALTNEQLTMQRAGYEALCAGKPLIISNKGVLVDYFEKSALFVDNSSQSIITQVNYMLNNKKDLSNKMVALRRNKIEEQDISIEKLRKSLGV